MGKFTKFMLTFALLVAGVGGVNATKLYATYGTPADNGFWDAETNTYTWTGSTNNLMSLFTFANGELAQYTSIKFTSAGYSSGKEYRLYFHGPNKNITFYSEGNKSLVFADRDEFKDVDMSTITGISFGGSSASGSIQLTNVYLEKPMTLTWNNDGTAEIDITDLTASGCFSLNDQTGVLTSTYDAGSTNWGRLTVNFPAGGVDLTSLTGFEVTSTGDNLFGGFEINGGTNKAFYSSPKGRNDLANYMTVSDVGNPSAITLWRWWNAETAGTMTISSIKLKGGVITASNPHETLLTSAMFVGGCENHIGEGNVGAGTTIYGNGSVLADQYVDLSAYNEMRIYGTPNKSIRLLFNWTSANQKEISGADVKLNGDGYYSLDLSTVAPQQLNAFKFPYDGQSGAITKVILYKNNIPVPYNYVISGTGQMTTSATAALADATVTSIDASGLTNTSAIALESANPNCLFVANAGKLSNTKNVIVDGTCANLELVDGKPFKAPAAFTATAAKFTKTVTAAGYATMVIPFGVATLPEGVEVYELSDVDGETIISCNVDAITKECPVMIKAAAGSYNFTAAGAEIAATAEGVVTNGLLNGGYATITVDADANNYVLQKNGDDVNFYLVTGTAATVKPFRAYLTAPTSARELTLNFGETTGISAALMNSDERIVKSEVYNLNGQRIAAPQKGLYIVNGKKVIVK